MSVSQADFERASQLYVETREEIEQCKEEMKSKKKKLGEQMDVFKSWMTQNEITSMDVAGDPIVLVAKNARVIKR